MVTPYHRPQESFTIEQIAAWIVTTQQKRMDLHLLFTEPGFNMLRDQSFRQMSDLVEASIEEVRVLSNTLQANSEALRARSARLRERSTALSERSARAREQSRQPGPSAEEIRAAEQPMLEMFKDNLHYALRGTGAPGTKVGRAS